MKMMGRRVGAQKKHLLRKFKLPWADIYGRRGYDYPWWIVEQHAIGLLISAPHRSYERALHEAGLQQSDHEVKQNQEIQGLDEPHDQQGEGQAQGYAQIQQDEEAVVEEAIKAPVGQDRVLGLPDCVSRAAHDVRWYTAWLAKIAV